MFQHLDMKERSDWEISSSFWYLLSSSTIIVKKHQFSILVLRMLGATFGCAQVGARGGMQTVNTGLHSQRQPPQGFIPRIPDVFPSGVNITVNGPIVGRHEVLAWLFNSESS